MRKIIVVGCIFLILAITSCNTDYSVDLKIRNSASKKVYITYVQKDNNLKVTKMLAPGESFAISKYDRPGKDLEWKTVWKYNIKSVVTIDSVASWKDYNIEGAWDNEELFNRTKAVLILSNNDFAN